MGADSENEKEVEEVERLTLVQDKSSAEGDLAGLTIRLLEKVCDFGGCVDAALRSACSATIICPSPPLR